MPTATVDGVALVYEVIGEGRPWVITPGGRFTKDEPGVRELATALAAEGNRVLIWDRPNCGESDVSFTGDSESAMQADALAGLLRELDLTPAVITGGSGGSRVSMLTVARHPDVAAGLGLWWISGGVFGLMSLGTHYCGNSLREAWTGGMEAVVELPEWAEVLERNPSNRQRFLDQDPREFVTTFERWMLAYCPCGDELVPGLPDASAAWLHIPASCSAVARPTPFTRAKRRSASRRCSRTRSSSSLPGVTGSGSSARVHTPPVTACSRGGRCWHPSC